MSFAILRALHTIIGDALDDIERIYRPELAVPPRAPSVVLPINDQPPYASPPPSPSISTHRPALDFPALDVPYDPADPAEQLTAHPAVVVAINRIVAATGQMAATVQTPFLSLCDASMAYHLPSCMRLLEASHTVEILREAGPKGLHVDIISQRNGVERVKLAHILRLLATHHILRECAPNTFAINRISSIVDSGNSVAQLRAWENEGRPEMKYHDTNGIAAFVGLNTDELQKSSAYLTEAYLLSPTQPLRAPFEFAFGTRVGFFGWLEGEGVTVLNGSATGKNQDKSHADVDEVATGPGAVVAPALGTIDTGIGGSRSADVDNWNLYRLARFGKAMSGTGSWEAPGAVLNGFDWHNLPRGSVIVDVGGGIGSTSMLLASAFSRAGTSSCSPPSGGGGGNSDNHSLDLGFKFVIQDREVVVEMGEKAWRSKCPELLDSGTARFQVHDFFTAQPIRNAAVFLLRVVLHDWPEAHARMILLKLREAATEETRLVLADFVLPLACVDDVGDADGGGALDGVDGAESMLASAPLLANLGKASANAYWMDLTMQVMFNAQERTLREIVALALSAGWKVIKVTRAVGSLFGYIVAVPAPMQRRARAGSGSAFFDIPGGMDAGGASDRVGVSAEDSKAGDDPVLDRGEMQLVERASSRCGTPTFGSRVDLPSVQEAMLRFGGGVVRSRTSGIMGRGSGQSRAKVPKYTVPSTPSVKKKPSPLSFSLPMSLSPSPASHRPVTSPRQSQPASPMARRMSQAPLCRAQSQQGLASSSPVASHQTPPSPMSPHHPHSPTLSRRSSYVHLSLSSQAQATPKANAPRQTQEPSLPIIHRSLPQPSPYSAVSRRSSVAQLYQSAEVPVSSIPVRQLQDPPPSPMAALCRQPPPSPVASRHPQITRRSSYAHLPQTGLRKRLDSIIVPPNSGGVGGGISMGSLLSNDGGGGVLNFGGGDLGNCSSVPLSGGSVLAAAARIERGIPPVPPSP